MLDLFPPAPDRLRRLQDLGWYRAGYTVRGIPLWMAPDEKYSVEQDEALDWLARRDAGIARAAEKLMEGTP